MSRDLHDGSERANEEEYLKGKVNIKFRTGGMLGGSSRNDRDPYGGSIWNEEETLRRNQKWESGRKGL